MRTNIAVALRYLYAWVGGAGAVAIDDMMEDAATVEISRTQIWQWLHHRTRTAEGLVITPSLVERDHRARRRRPARGGDDDREHRHVEEARDVFIEAAMKEELPDFFTPYAYVRYLIDRPLQPKGPISRQDLRRSIQGPFPTAELVGAAS